MITFVAVCYNEVDSVYGFISSMRCQTNPNWKLIIYQNGKNSNISHIVKLFEDSRIKYIESDINTGYWGCYNRIHALNELVDTEYIIQTSIQDYYIPTTVDEILKHKDIDIIYFNCIHNHISFDVLNTELELGKIDWGCFAIKTQIAKSVGINYPMETTADGLFIQDCLKSGLINTTRKINKILTIHN
jgi:hypothetical protein